MNKIYFSLSVALIAIIGMLSFAPKDVYTLVSSKIELENTQEGIWKLNKQTGELAYCRFNYSADFLTCTKQENEK